MPGISQKALAALLSTFQKAQSEYLGLDTPASQEELLRLGALSKRSRRSPPMKVSKKRSSNPVKRITYNAWEKLENEGITPGEARAMYNETVDLLKRKYNSRKNKSQTHAGSTKRSGRTRRTKTNSKPETVEFEDLKIYFADTVALQYEAEIRLERTMAASQSASTAMPMPSAIDVQHPNSPLWIQPMVSIFNLSDFDFDTEYEPEAHECATCGRELTDSSFKCQHCQPHNYNLTPADKIQKLLAKVAEDREDFVFSNKMSGADDKTTNSADSLAIPRADTELFLPNIAFLDISDSVWRCTVCGWEIVANNECLGMCGKGHFVD